MVTQRSKFLLWGNVVNLDLNKDTFPSEKELQEMDEHFLNPIHGFFTTSSGEKMHYLKYLPEGQTKLKGVLVFQHGIGASSLGHNMPLLARAMLKNGFALYVPDMIGHGFSEGCRFYIPRGRWTINRDGLEAFTQFAASEHEKGTPLFIMGESYGGCLTIHVAKMWQSNPDKAPSGFAGICLIAPAIIADLPSIIVVFFLRYFLAVFFPRWVPFFMPNPVSPDRVWKDEKVRIQVTTGREVTMGLCNGGQAFRLGTAAGLLSAVEKVREVAIPDLKVPFAVAHGTDDYVVPITGTDYLLEHAHTSEEDRAVRRVIGGYHDFLAEDTGADTIMFFTNWMNSRISKKVS